MEKTERHIILDSLLILHVEEKGERDQLIRVLHPSIGKCQLLAKNSRSSKRFGESLMPGNIISGKIDKLNDFFGIIVEADLVNPHKSTSYQMLMNRLRILSEVDKNLLLGGGQEVFSLLKDLFHTQIQNEEFWAKFHQQLGNG